MGYRTFKAEIYHGNSDNRQCEQCRQAPLTIHCIFQTCRGFLEWAKNKWSNIYTYTHIYCSKKNRWSCQQYKHRWLLKIANNHPAKQPFLAMQAARSELSLSSLSLQATIIWDPDTVVTRSEDFQESWSPSLNVFAQFHPPDLLRIIALLKITHMEQLVGPEMSWM